MANRIFAGQSALRIVVKCFCDLEDALSAVIHYKKPDGSTGEFAAAVIDADKGVLSHECIQGEIDKPGWWSFWAFIEFEDGRSAPGEAAKVFVWSEGSG